MKAIIFAIVLGGVLGSAALWWVLEFPEKHATLVQQLLIFEWGAPSLPPPLVELNPSAVADSEWEGVKKDAKAVGQEAPSLEKEKTPSPLKKTHYAVQVARCLDKICVADFQKLLNYAGFSSNVKTILEATPVFEVVSRASFTAHQSSQWLQQINASYRPTGTAFRKNFDSRYWISLGLYPDQHTAQQVQADVNFQLAGQLVFDVNPTQQKILYHLVRSGNFARKEQAVALQKRLRSQLEQTQGIWIVTEPNL